MLVWFAAACVLLTPIKGMAPVEDETPTMVAQAATPTQQPTAIVTPQPTATEITPDLEMVTRLLEEDSNSDLVVSAWYPFIQGGSDLAGVGQYNQYAQDTLQNDLDAFKASLADFPEVTEIPYPSTYINGYQVFSATSDLVSLELDMSTYVNGAAHPNPYTITINYDLSGGKPLALADLFEPGSAYLEKLSSLAKTSLEEREMLYFEDGVQPNEENFRTWVISEDGLTLIFDVYQVAPYVAGPQRVTIPFDELGDILNQEILQGLSAIPITVDPIQLPIIYPQASQTP